MISSLPGTIISAVGTLIMIILFVFELQHYVRAAASALLTHWRELIASPRPQFTVTTSTTLVVDELVDEVLRVNFNLTLYQVPCEHLSVDVSDMTGTTRHNITKVRGASDRLVTDLTAAAASSVAASVSQHPCRGASLS